MSTAVYDGPVKEDASGRVLVAISDDTDFATYTPTCFYCGEPTRYMDRLWHEETVNELIKGEVAWLVPLHMRCFLHRAKALME